MTQKSIITIPFVPSPSQCLCHPYVATHLLPAACSPAALQPSLLLVLIITMGCAPSRPSKPSSPPRHQRDGSRKYSNPYDYGVRCYGPHHYGYIEGSAAYIGPKAPISYSRAYRCQTKKNPRYDVVREKTKERREGWEQERNPVFREHRRGRCDDWYF